MSVAQNKIVAIDPGVHQTGWAVFENDRLINAGMAPSLDLFSFLPSQVFKMVIEKPEKYPDKHITHRDIDKLLGLVAFISDQAKQQGWRVEAVKPSRWKGQVPKAVHQNRIKAAMKRGEGAAVTWPAPYLCHNVFDAIGIGLFACGRLGRGGRRRVKVIQKR